jgi:predicted O-linked N-acetylglucosamine transferase (SPINDLY family)
MDQTPPTASPELLVAAVRALQAGDLQQAELLCRQLLVLEPRNADAFHVLGLALTQSGRSDAAIEPLRSATHLRPGNAIAWFNLGIAYANSEQFSAAAQCQRNAIQLQPGLAEAHNKLSVASARLGDFGAAIAAARRAAELQPHDAGAHFHLGNLLREEGRLPEAVAAYNTALRVRPHQPETHFYFGVALLQMEQPAEALAHFQESLRLNPASSAAQQAIADALRLLGQIAEAKAAYARVAPGMNAMRALEFQTLAEIVAPERSSIETYQAGVKLALRQFTAWPGKVDLSTLHMNPATPSLMLAYYGGDVRPILEQYAEAMDRHIPRFPSGKRHGKPRLGIVVTYRHERVFARCWGGIVQRLSRELFEIKVVCSRAGAKALQAMLNLPQDEYLVLPAAIDEAARSLHEQELDWLHYWEIGTDAINYYLPYFKPAAGQSTCWGWPVTSGNPAVDSFLSSGQVEPADGQAHYTERLVLLKELPVYIARPTASPLPRSHFGLEDGQHVYWCAQNLRKFQPDFDLVLANLLRSDPQGILLIAADPQPAITNLLTDRFRRTMPDVMSRVRVMPRMAREDYLALLAISDVSLDPLHFGAGITAYDAAAVGTPLVTLPGAFQRTRWAAAINRRMGVSQLNVASFAEYVAKAIEIASSPDLRRSLHRQILENGRELFEHLAVVAEHEAYFSEAIAATRR